MNIKKLLALLMAMAIVLSLAACQPEEGSSAAPGGTTGGNGNTTGNGGIDGPGYTVETFEGDFIYKDWVGTLASNWNPLTYSTEDDGYLGGFIESGLYSLRFNDELHPQEGRDPFEGYVILPEMASEMPVDVTEQVKKDHPEYGIPESATSGYAWSVKLNPNCTFANGKKITAETYVKSAELLLRSELNNYRAPDYYARGDYKIAGARAYNNAGKTTYKDNFATGNFDYVMADLVKGADGQYTTPDGRLVFIALDFELEWTGGNTLADYVNAYGEAYFDVTNWSTLIAMADDSGLIPLTDENLALFAPVTTGNPAWGESDAELPAYFAYVDKSYPADVKFEDTVGVYAADEYEVVFVLENAMSGFYLYLSLGVPLVDPELYEECLELKNGVWTCSYNTSVGTTNSYGPYKLSEYQSKKYLRLVRNESWWGYSDGQHIYKDPHDGKVYPLYQTTEIYTQVVPEAATAKLMFMKGELMAYGLQASDYATLKNSEWLYITPAETVYCLIMNGHIEAIQERENASEFDKSTTDLETMTVNEFRRAMALVYDKNNLCEVISPSRTAGLGILGTTYVYDIDNCLYYRDTDQAKKVLCDFYSVNIDDYASLDDAVASITGYNPTRAKELFTEAFQVALDKGYITDNDKDGISDQTVTIEYSLSASDSFQTALVNYLNDNVRKVAEGTPFEGKILIKESPAYGNDWSNMIRNGLSDCVLGGFGGSNLNPFATMASYLDSESAFDGNWNNNYVNQMTKTIDGEEITMSVMDWCNCVNGSTIEVNGKSYNFGEGQADMDIRLDILAALEGEILKTYNHIPMIQNQGATLLSKQVYYVVEEFSGILGGRGGIAYMKYDYNEAEWAEYVKSCGGELSY